MDRALEGEDNDDDDDSENDEQIPQVEIPDSEKFAVTQFKKYSELGLLKVASARIDQDNRTTLRASQGSIGSMGDNDSQAPGSPSLAPLRESGGAVPGGGTKLPSGHTERLIEGGVVELRGEVEALRGHYAALIASDCWEGADHEKIALQLDAVGEAAAHLGATAIEDEARVVASGVRKMMKKIDELGSNLL